MKASQLLSVLAALSMICGIMVLQGCGDNTKAKKSTSSQQASSKSDKDDDEDSGDSPSDNAGNQAIAFHNNLLGFIGASRSAFKDLDKQIKASDDFAKSDSNYPGWGNIYISASNFPKIPGYKFAAPKSFSDKDQEFFNTRIKTVQDSCRDIISITSALSTYYKAEDYKDDWHKKFLVSSPKLYDLMGKIAEADEEMLERSGTITEEIDAKNLASSPIGIYVLNMRYMLKKAREQSNLLMNPELKDTRYGTGVSAEERQQMIARCKETADKVDALLKEMDEMAEKYKAVDREKIKGTNLERAYDGFFANYEKGKIDLRRILRDLREKGYYNDQHNVKYYTESLSKSHDDFVDIINGK